MPSTIIISPAPVIAISTAVSPHQHPPTILTATTPVKGIYFSTPSNNATPRPGSMSSPRPEYVLQRGAACSSCHKKKQRCTGEKPACQACLKSNIDCVYRPLSKPRSHQLTDRIQELEARIRQLTEAQDNNKSSSSSGSQSTNASGSYRDNDLQYQQEMSKHYRPSERSQSRAENVPGSNMMWTYDPAVSNLDAMQPVEISPQLRQNLIQIFMHNREKCYFEVHAASFMAALAVSEGSPEALHPALIDAVLLVGIYFSRAPSLDRYEAIYLAQARQKLSDSYNHTDRLHDFVRASNLITFYYLCKGRYPEAYEQVVSSLHMAVTCGMHQISSSVWRPISPSASSNTFLPPPRNGIDIGERIHTFWQTFSFDKVISLATSRPAHLKGGPSLDPLLQISTPWPRLLSEYESGGISDPEQQSVSSLFRSSKPSPDPPTLSTLKSQGLLLVSHAVDHLESGNPSAQYILNLDNAIQKFTSRLPSLRSGGEFGEIPSTPGRSPLNHTLVVIHTCAYSASLVLHQQGVDVTARRRCAVAIQALLSIVNELSDTDYTELFIGLGHIWFVACRIIINISHAAHGAVGEQHAQWARVLIAAMKRLSMVYFPLGFQVQQLQEILPFEGVH